LVREWRATQPVRKGAKLNLFTILSIIANGILKMKINNF
jgi:hypothetical protein